MPSLLLCDTTHPTDTIGRELGLPEGLIRDRYGQTPRWMRANTPHVLGSDPHWSDLALCASLEPHGSMLTRMCLHYGGATTLALADLHQELAAGSSASDDLGKAAAGDLYDKLMEARKGTR